MGIYLGIAVSIVSIPAEVLANHISTWLEIVDESSRDDQPLSIRDAATKSIIESRLLFVKCDYMIKLRLWLIALRLLNDDTDEVRRLLYHHMSSMMEQSMTPAYCWQHAVIRKLADAVQHAISTDESTAVESLLTTLEDMVSHSYANSDFTSKVFDTEPLNQFIEPSQIIKAVMDAVRIALDGQSDVTLNNNPATSNLCSRFLDFGETILSSVHYLDIKIEMLRFQHLFRPIFASKSIMNFVRSALIGESTQDENDSESASEAKDDLLMKYRKIAARLNGIMKEAFPSMLAIIDEISEEALRA